MSKTQFLYLSEEDLLQVGVLDASKCVATCEEVFGLLCDGDYLMGGLSHNDHGLSIVFPKETSFRNMPIAGPERRFIAMPAYLGGDFAICGEKWYGSNTKNPKECGLPRSVLMITLNDKETCEPICYMSGNLISSMRTGSIPGVFLKYFGSSDSKTVGVIGVGPVQKATILAIYAVMPNIKKVICKSVHMEHTKEFANWVTEETGIDAVAIESMEDCISQGDIVSIAASPKEPLFIKNEWIKKGASVLLTSPIEADDDFWLSNHLCFDNTKMHMAYYDEALQAGGILKANNGWGKMYKLMEEGRLKGLADQISLGDVVRGKKDRRQSNDTKEIFVTSGQVLFDLAWAYNLFKIAEKKKIGTKLKIWDEPYWM
ncbi:tyramine oxidase subunit B [uncultured Clostridium sp.]|uniref:tyramine oxidase subunit B n=1 Tax=uncultured Clostridium sp. TaxID=59620 RepID=UPI0025D151D7|nr:tyramine oxidase subunit B [uncultured Clostridium sp.]